MRLTEVYRAQLKLLEDKLQKIPDDAPNKGLWESLLYILTYFGGALERMEKTISGNGKTGLVDRVDTVEDKLDQLEGRVKVIQSDVRETLNMTRKQQGIETDKEDKTPERTWFIEKVLPGLVQTLIISVIAVLVTLVVINIKGIVP